MHDADRFRLLGSYKTPKVRLGRPVRCLLHGEVRVVGYTDARIPWPLGQVRNGKAVAVYGDLARAIRRGSAQAVMFWWGVKSHTAWRWRKALGVGPRDNEGTHRLRSEHALGPAVAAGRAKAHAPSPATHRRTRPGARGSRRARSASPGPGTSSRPCARPTAAASTRTKPERR